MSRYISQSLICPITLSSRLKKEARIKFHKIENKINKIILLTSICVHKEDGNNPDAQAIIDVQNNAAQECNQPNELILKEILICLYGEDVSKFLFFYAIDLIEIPIVVDIFNLTENFENSHHNNRCQTCFGQIFQKRREPEHDAHENSTCYDRNHLDKNKFQHVK